MDGATPGALDVLVVGSGVAGLSAAVRLAELEGARVGVLTKGSLEQSTTRFAQGGVAAVLPGDEDSTDRHLADTLAAGAGLCDEAAVGILVGEGPSRVTELIALGAVFDRLPSGALARALEGGHSSARVLHAGGTATGAEVERALVTAAIESAALLLEDHFALDLVVAGGRCTGVRALAPDGDAVEVEARNVVLAAGGAGQLFSVTTNPDEATGDGLAMALRAGVITADLEFVQFHPTALHHPVMPRPLLSEALRGHGAVLRDERGERFVDELAPRDVVSRAIASVLTRSGSEHVWLDCTGLEAFRSRFPTIHAALASAGYDPSTDLLPVAPAAHYLCGGIATDLFGASSLPGLWAAGEVACTGVHGANRLASNSLLEGMVFGSRVVEAIADGHEGPTTTGVLAGLEGAGASIPLVPLEVPLPAQPPSDIEAADQAVGAGVARRRLGRAMSSHCGIVRDADSLARARSEIDSLSAGWGEEGTAREKVELDNLATVAVAVVTAATARTESRGAHTRADFPERDDRLRCRFAVSARALRPAPTGRLAGG